MIFPAYLLILQISLAVLLSCSSERYKSWTVIFYGNGDNNLEDYILSDLKEMEQADIPGNITVIALIDRPSTPSGKFGSWSDTKLFRVVHSDSADTLASEELSSEELNLTADGEEELDMSDPSVIASLISFCRRSYPSDGYALVIGGHGDGWIPPSISVLKSIGYDSTPKYSATGIPELADALRYMHPDLIIFDSCSMGNIETLYLLKGCAEYIVASPNTLPLAGFDYTDLLSSVRGDMMPLELSFAISSSWQRSHDDISMMVYSMAGLSDFISSGYIEKISAAAISDPDGAIAARKRSIVYNVDGITNHADIADFSKKFIPGISIPFEIFIFTVNEPMLSIYFPSSSGDAYSSYAYTGFAVDTSWDEAVDTVLK